MWPEQHNTQDLLDSAQQGSDQAVNQLLEHHRDALRKMVGLRLDRQIAQRIDASDVVQDVMLEAAQRLKQYLQDPQIPFHIWLRQIAKDRMIDLHRRHHAQRRAVDREQPLALTGLPDRSSIDLAGQLADDQLTPAAASIRNELEQRFLNAIDQLEEQDREVIIMRHVEHLSNSDVAAALNLTTAAAGMRHFRAIQRLRTILADPPSLG
ncbi:MAG: sigma-70 family RNA polymerase sigma factor [Planctomycetaceae bacterium]|nr:sigma-70 family RNA polymerase sigma factor [Planctomycetaceae bacterium]MCA9044962.1 sigma-70 family RNA polymerase sigma factor [Planctomycetaceae bacterium]